MADEALVCVPVPLDVASETYDALVNDRPSCSVFDAAQASVLAQLRATHYPLFLDSDLYHRCLFTLRFEKDNGADIDIPAEEHEPLAAPSQPQHTDDRTLALWGGVLCLCLCHTHTHTLSTHVCDFLTSTSTCRRRGRDGG
jgi:hypothetical protein